MHTRSFVCANLDVLHIKFSPRLTVNFPVASGPQTYNLPPAGMPPHGPPPGSECFGKFWVDILVPLESDYVVCIRCTLYRISVTVQLFKYCSSDNVHVHFAFANSCWRLFSPNLHHPVRMPPPGMPPPMMGRGMPPPGMLPPGMMPPPGMRGERHFEELCSFAFVSVHNNESGIIIVVYILDWPHVVWGGEENDSWLNLWARPWPPFTASAHENITHKNVNSAQTTIVLTPGNYLLYLPLMYYCFSQNLYVILVVVAHYNIRLPRV